MRDRVMMCWKRGRQLGGLWQRGVADFAVRSDSPIDVKTSIRAVIHAHLLL
jgi:hypothetical protein